MKMGYFIPFSILIDFSWEQIYDLIIFVTQEMYYSKWSAPVTYDVHQTMKVCSKM